MDMKTIGLSKIMVTMVILLKMVIIIHMMIIMNKDNTHYLHLIRVMVVIIMITNLQDLEGTLMEHMTQVVILHVTLEIIHHQAKAVFHLLREATLPVKEVIRHWVLIIKEVTLTLVHQIKEVTLKLDPILVEPHTQTEIIQFMKTTFTTWGRGMRKITRDICYNKFKS